MFVLPELKNPYTAYEPYIDAKTMEVHHQLHHGGYVKKLNHACVDAEISCDRIEDLFEKMSDLPPAIRNNAGGHYNHTVFWSLLDDGMTTPSPELHKDIEETFGGLEDFKAEFTKAALGVFGSGWTWLVINHEGKLEIVTTKQQDNPLMNDVNLGYPILGADVWEHAYYLSYQNRRVEYLKALWSLIDWNVVSERYTNKPEMNDLA
ncbi:MAG: Fe-Mn family superoxide dismutase [Candidatus Paceibacteria bacterium]|jgi:Fe-Mn family superoxide dismutase